MTLNELKQEIQEEFQTFLTGIEDGVRIPRSPSDLDSFLDTALSRIAEATKDAIVPEADEPTGNDGDVQFVAKRATYLMREQMLTNFKRFSE